MSLYSPSNNIHFNQPPLMNDGRNNTNWEIESITNQKIKSQAGIKSNWDYRQYLQKNANQIMKFNYLDFNNSSGNIPNDYFSNSSTSNSPFVFKSTHDKRKPPVGYNNSDLKQNYLSREQLNARLISPSINTDNFKQFNKY
jgi:hypothetical protein